MKKKKNNERFEKPLQKERKNIKINEKKNVQIWKRMKEKYSNK